MHSSFYFFVVKILIQCIPAINFKKENKQQIKQKQLNLAIVTINPSHVNNKQEMRTDLHQSSL